MNKRVGTFAVVGGLIVAGGLAAFQGHSSPASATPSQVGPSVSREVSQEVPSPFPSPEPGGALPPNHPPLGATHAFGHGTPEPANEAATIAWTPPPGWQAVPNASPMRIATYRIPRAPGDKEDGELTVTRAGGTTEANLQRWVGQFDGSSTQARVERTVQGLPVTVLLVRGTYLGGGMMQSAPSSPQPSWGLLGSIVETPGSPYFFKMLGPVATVGAARPAFDAMIAGVTRL
jgi:hypothetical protein